jgi:hypothetical protein
VATLTERDLENPDPLRLSREIAKAAGVLARFRARQARGEGQDEDPFFMARLLSGKTAFHAVSELPASDPLRAPLLRWVYLLAEARIDLPTTMRVAAELHVTEHVVNQPEHGRLTLGSMLRRALAERKRREAWLASYLGTCGTLATAVSILWERRAEVASRMGLGSPDDVEGAGADVYAAAEQWLARTDDAFGSVAADSLSGLVSLALAEDAPGQFSRHLSPRTILDFFRETDLLRSVDLDPGPLPDPVAPASIPRALYRVFSSFVDATAPKDQPFVVAHDPYGLRRYLFGALFATLPGEAAFARRAFQVDPGKLTEYRRKFASAFLVESRTAALKVLLRKSALEGRKSFGQAFESGTERALGVPLPPDARGTLYHLENDDPQRFAGLLLSAARAAELRNEYDEDWYRNPRAVERMRDEARLSPEVTTSSEALTDAQGALYDSIASAL